MKDHLEFKKQLWDIVDRRKEELLEICSELIRIPSVEEDGIDQIAEHTSSFLKNLGISCEILHPVDRIPCIVAEIGRKDGPVGILNGHQDVVAAGDLSRWNYDPFCGTITETQILGRGASDMKCGVGVFLFLLKLIQEEGLRLKGTLRLHLVHDEEKGGEKGSKWLVEHGYADGASFCLNGEPTSYDYVEIGQKGRVRYEFVTRGADAFDQMVRVLHGVRTLCQLDGTVTPSEKAVVEASKKVICHAMKLDDVGDAIDHVNVSILKIEKTEDGKGCRAFVAFGVPFMITQEQVDDRIAQSVADAKADCQVTCLYWQSGAGTEISDPLVQSVKANAELVTGRTMTPAYQWATSDAKYYRNHGIPTIHFGPSNNKGIHSYNEDVEIVDIMKCAKTHLAVIADLIGFEQEEENHD